MSNNQLMQAVITNSETAASIGHAIGDGDEELQLTVENLVRVKENLMRASAACIALERSLVLGGPNGKP